MPPAAGAVAACAWAGSVTTARAAPAGTNAAAKPSSVSLRMRTDQLTDALLCRIHAEPEDGVMVTEVVLTDALRTVTPVLALMFTVLRDSPVIGCSGTPMIWPAAVAPVAVTLVMVMP